MTAGYERFKAEMLAAQARGWQLVLLIEDPLTDVYRGWHRSALAGSSCVQKLWTLWFRYGVLPVFCQDRTEACCYIVETYECLGREFVALGRHWTPFGGAGATPPWGSHTAITTATTETATATTDLPQSPSPQTPPTGDCGPLPSACSTGVKSERQPGQGLSTSASPDVSLPNTGAGGDASAPHSTSPIKQAGWKRASWTRQWVKDPYPAGDETKAKESQDAPRPAAELKVSKP